MSRVSVEIVFDVPDALAREPKEIMWLLENVDYNVVKFHHINRMNNL